MKKFTENFSQGVTLIELLVVIMVLGILAVLTIPNFTKLRERTYDKEAIANLIAIWHAEEMYHMETGRYFPPPSGGGDVFVDDIEEINQQLRLNLNNRTFQYHAEWTGGLYTVRASRPGSSPSVPAGYGREFQITEGEREIRCFDGGTGACPWTTPYEF